MDQLVAWRKVPRLVEDNAKHLDNAMHHLIKLKDFLERRKMRCATSVPRTPVSEFTTITRTLEQVGQLGEPDVRRSWMMEGERRAFRNKASWKIKGGPYDRVD